MKKNIIILALLLFVNMNCCASNDSIYTSLVKLLISQKVLKVESVQGHKSKDLIYISELITESKEINVDFGVYKFSSALQEDGKSYILIKNKDCYEVFEENESTLIIRYLLEEKRKHKLILDDCMMGKYIYSILSEQHTSLNIVESIGIIRFHHSIILP